MSAHEQVVACTNCGRENPPQATYCSRCGSSLAGEGDPLIGKQVGKYVMEQRIGAGGSGTVYRGAHIDLGRRVAIKVLLPNLVTDDESKARFEREAKVLAGLEHENVVSIIDVGYVNGVGPYMVMEWLEGLTLFESRRQRGFLELHEILPIMDQLTSALSYMHRSGVVHRDLKPENMMLVARAGQNSVENLSTRLVKLYDFGIALFTAGDDRKLTAAGMVVGTPHYMAPEQIIVDAPVDYRADLYAVGAILYELISGRPPFWGAKRPVEVMEKHLRHDPPNLHELLPDRLLPHGIQGVVHRALAKKPAERFQDGRELYEALEAAVNGPAFQPYTVQEEERTIIRATELWDVPARQGGPGSYGSHDSLPVLPSAEVASVEHAHNAGYGAKNNSLPFPPLGSQGGNRDVPNPNPPYTNANYYPHPQAPPPPSNPFLPAAPFPQESSNPALPSAPYAPTSSPNLSAAPGHVGHGHASSLPPMSGPYPNSLSEGTQTKPGVSLGVPPTVVDEDTINVSRSSSKRWLFAVLILTLGMLLILGFFFLFQWRS